MKARLQAAESDIKRLWDENARLDEECFELKIAKALLEGDQHVYPVPNSKAVEEAVEDDTWKPEGNEIWPGGDDKRPSIDKWPSIDEHGIQGDAYEGDNNKGDSDDDEDGILGDSEPSSH
jgi:hypothetical protein